MEFGAWVQSLRSNRKMDVRTFARLVGVDASTISRVEQGRSQVTVPTAVRICEGVEATPADLLWALQGRRPKWATGHQRMRESEVVTISDLEAFLCSIHRHWDDGCAWLTSLLNQIVSWENGYDNASTAISLIVSEDIEKLLQDSRLYQFKIHYPEAMKAEAIWELYLQGGALSLVDIGVYVKQARRGKRVTLSGLEESGKLSASVLSRLETGALERIKLMDVLALDEKLDQEGKIVAMYWRACTLMDMVARLHTPDEQAGAREQDLKVVELFLTICRWLSCLSETNHTFVIEFRQRFDQAMNVTRAGLTEDTPV
jgi:transcriptional regulator with XRE-family HTH domain